MQTPKGVLSIKVMIADRPYPVRVEAADEETVRKAAKMVNDKMKDFRENYAADKQDLLAMAALMFAVDLMKSEKGLRQKDDLLSDKITEIEGVLKEFISAD